MSIFGGISRLPLYLEVIVVASRAIVAAFAGLYVGSFILLML